MPFGGSTKFDSAGEPKGFLLADVFFLITGSTCVVYQEALSCPMAA